MQKFTFFCLAGFLLLTFSSCYRIKNSNGGGQIEKLKARKVSTSDVAIPDSLAIEVIASGLTFPTGITFDESGTPYVVEAGYSYGEIWTTPKLLKIEKDGSATTIATGEKNGPWNGVDYYKGNFFIAEGGTLKGGKILKINSDGKIEVLYEGLPSFGDHHTNGPAVKDGYVYFGQGTATNSAVVGPDNYDFGWLKRFPEFHDIPCEDITLNAHNFVSQNPLTTEKDKVATGPYLPFGQAVEDGMVIQGKIPCSGAIFKLPVTGGQPELVAWGLRNPYGLAINKEDRLYVVENSFDVRGNRPVWGTGDVLYEIKNGQWYGWPDYAAGRPLFGREEFVPPGCDAPVKILKTDPGTPPKPIAELAVHSSSNGMAIISNPAFGSEGEILIAQFGDMAPNVGKVWLPVGFKVVKVNPETGVIEDFAANKSKKNGPASWLKNNGLERPIDVAFSPDGKALYIVDFGILTMSKKGAAPVKETGVIWKITKKQK